MTGLPRFLVLGPLEVLADSGAPLDLGGRQPRAVLARLLLSPGRPVPVDTLLQAVWDDDLPASAPGTLQTYVSRLRRSLGAEGGRLLRHEVGGYRLAVAPEQVDAHVFEQAAAQGGALLAEGRPAEAARTLRDALALWRGKLLADLDAPFVAPYAARLHERRLTAEEDLFDAELRTGGAAAAVPAIADAVRREPLRERLRGLLALALYRAGRQADALAALEEGRRLLAEELGLDQSRELAALQAQILQQDPELDGPPAPVREPAVPGQRAAPPDGGLIGRTGELRVLLGALEESLGGGAARYAVIEGEPGMGKTRLAQELLRHAQARGALALSADTLEIGAAPAFGPWLQLVRAATQRLGSPPAGSEQLLEGGRSLAPGLAPTTVAAAIADDVAELVAAVAAPAGLVVLLDDLQWADPASLDLLVRLGPRLGSSGVLFVLTLRHLEVGADGPVAEALAQITRQLGTRRVTLRGLTLAESGQLLERSAGAPVPDGVVAALHARSDGNPFFITELARLIGEEGHLDLAGASARSVPTGVRDVLSRRVARLPQPTRQLLEVAAVLGREAPVELVAAVAQRPLDEVLDDVEPALATRLLELPPDAPGSLRFPHALVRETLEEGLTTLRRARLHLRAADAILAVVGQTDDTAEVVAEHLWQAAALGVADRAAQALEQAASVALRRQALVSAESVLERAARLHRAAGTEGGLAELRVLRQLSFVGAALHGYAVNADGPLVRRARELAASTQRTDILLDMVWAQWAGCDTGGQAWRAEDLVREAEELVTGSSDPLLLAGVAAMRGFTCRHSGQMRRAEAETTRALRLFEQAGPTQEAGFYLNGYLTSIGFRHWAHTMTRGLDLEALERDYHAQEMPFARMVVALFGSASCLVAGDPAGLELWSTRMLDADPDMLLSFWSSAAELYSGVSRLQRGDLEAGLARIDSGTQHLRQAGGRTMLAGVLAEGAQALGDAGRRTDAQRLLDAARVEIAEAKELAYEPLVDLAAARLAVLDGDGARAGGLLDRAEATARAHGSAGLLPRLAAARAQLLVPG